MDAGNRLPIMSATDVATQINSLLTPCRCPVELHPDLDVLHLLGVDCVSLLLREELVGSSLGPGLDLAHEKSGQSRADG